LTKVPISSTPREVRNFGLLFTVICGGVAGYLRLTESAGWSWFLVAAIVFFISAFIGQPFLRPLYIFWMTLAFVLGWINTRLLLGLFFYLVLTPIALVMRVVGKDPLEKRFDRSAPTYWKKRAAQPFEPKNYERLF
jgi:hypothetical protein